MGRGKQNRYRGKGGRYDDERDFPSNYHDDRRDDRQHHRQSDFPRFNDGKIARQRNKKSNRFHIERQIEEDFNVDREFHAERRPQQFRKGGIKRIPGSDLWYKIMIRNVKAPKDTILKLIIGASHIPVLPVYYHLRGEHAFFFVETQEMANSITRLNLVLPTGEKVFFGNTTHGPIPHLPVDEGMQIKLREVLARRYDSVNKKLDLSNFHYDESLCHEYYVPLIRPFNMKEVMRIIVEKIPDIRSLDLSENKLSTVDNMDVLVDKGVELKALNLADNKEEAVQWYFLLVHPWRAHSHLEERLVIEQFSMIHNLAVLVKLKGLPLETLMLRGNPAVDRLLEKGTDQYRSEVRRYFPKILTLDSEQLPPPVTFDVEPEVLKAPPTQESYLVSEGVKEVLQTFLQQYYTLYDQDRRSELSEAYREDALFSLSSGLLPKCEENQARLGPYMADSRNLLRVKDSSVRAKLLRQGRTEVMDLIERLPKTEHDPSSFRVDVTIVTPGLMSINLKGVFREILDKKPVLRSFMRFLTIVPTPTGGFCITNELLFVTNASQAQIKTAFKPPETPAVPQALPSTSTSTMSIQEEMIAQFSLQSGMNAEFSRQCLECRNWDYQAAAELFQQMAAAKAIPDEAFIR